MILFLRRRIFFADRQLLVSFVCCISVLYLSCVFTSSVLAEVMSAIKMPVQPSQSTASNTPFAKDYFGLHVIDINGSKTVWPPNNFGNLRLIDSSERHRVLWAFLEPSQGKWLFGDLDRLVHEAELRNAKILLVLGQTPTWASQRPGEVSPFGASCLGCSAEPRDIKDWQKYVRTVATRYKGRIQAYEIWNEMNVAFWTGSWAKMAELEREAYQILKSVDPQITVVSASMTNAKRPALDHYLNTGNGSYADIIGYHFYTQQSSPEEMLNSIRMVRDALDKHGLGIKPIWNTETGWLIPEDDGSFSDPRAKSIWKDWKHLTPEQGAAYVMRSLVIARQAGVERFYWYGWNHGALGLTSGMGKIKRMAAISYLTTANWLVGSFMEGCVIEGEVWSCQLSRGNKKSWLVWSVSREAPIPLKIREQSVALERFDQSHLESVPVDATIGEVPILFLGQHGAW